MTIGTNITVANFWDTIPFQQTDGLRLNHNKELASKANGGSIDKNLSDALWGGSFSTPPLQHRRANGYIALLNAMLDQQATFFAYDLIGKYPMLDPTGSIVGASSVQINSITNPSAISLKGLPVGYVLSRGDLIQHTYSTSHTALFAVAELTVTANGSGVTPVFSIVPKLRQLGAVNDACSLKKPQMLAQILPGTLDHPRTIDRTTIKFTISQVIDA